MTTAAAHDETEAVPRHNDRERSDRRAKGQRETTASAQAAYMQDDEVDEERHERPNLFRVPAPESAPAEVRPARAENDSRRQEERGTAEHRRDYGGDALAVLRIDRAARRLRLVASESVMREGNERDDPGDRAERVTHDDREDVDRKPEIAAQNGDEGLDVRIELDRVEVRGGGDERGDRRACG